MNLDYILNRLWTDYTAQNPSAAKIHTLFTEEGESVANDHIAFSTKLVAEVNYRIVNRFTPDKFQPVRQ